MGKLSKVLGKMGKKMGTLNGLHQRERVVKDSGKMMSKMEEEYSSIQRVPTRVSFKTFLNMGLERKNLQMETSTKASIKMENPKGREYTNGIVGEDMRVFSRTE